VEQSEQSFCIRNSALALTFFSPRSLIRDPRDSPIRRNLQFKNQTFVIFGQEASLTILTGRFSSAACFVGAEVKRPVFLILGHYGFSSVNDIDVRETRPLSFSFSFSFLGIQPGEQIVFAHDYEKGGARSNETEIDGMLGFP